ncbi:P-loop containing nucleoside triphosphate hydrolase protein [Tuber brumale]|nr:P-loop containing nucleoside triphosphate hydrolase protein [Tuber brumale]
MPEVANARNCPHPPPGPGRQVNTTPEETSPGGEIIIALMGMTGAGKSYFIREVSGNSEVVVSCDLYSCTREVQSYSFEYGGVKITLVDTPGFDDSNRSDTEVLQDIENWTSTTYREKRLLSGIIYLHPITDSRMGGSAMKNLRVFQGLCGQEVLENVFLTTTKWSNVDLDEGEIRENSLRNGDFWGRLIDRGATLQRFHGTRESGLELIRKLMPNERKPLDLQVQIVNHHMTLLETNVGKCINGELIELEKKHRKEIESLKRAFNEVIKAKNSEMEVILAAERKAQKELEKVEAERRLLEKLHLEEVERRKEREMQEGAENHDKAVISVATRILGLSQAIIPEAAGSATSTTASSSSPTPSGSRSVTNPTTSPTSRFLQ